MKNIGMLFFAGMLLFGGITSLVHRRWITNYRGGPDLEGAPAIVFGGTFVLMGLYIVMLVVRNWRRRASLRAHEKESEE